MEAGVTPDGVGGMGVGEGACVVAGVVVGKGTSLDLQASKEKRAPAVAALNPRETIR